MQIQSGILDQAKAEDVAKTGGSHGDTLLLLYNQTRRSYPVRSDLERLDRHLPDVPGYKRNLCPSGQRRRGLNTRL